MQRVPIRAQRRAHSEPIAFADGAANRTDAKVPTPSSSPNATRARVEEPGAPDAHRLIEARPEVDHRDGLGEHDALSLGEALPQRVVERVVDHHGRLRERDREAHSRGLARRARQRYAGAQKSGPISSLYSLVTPARVACAWSKSADLRAIGDESYVELSTAHVTADVIESWLESKPHLAHVVHDRSEQHTTVRTTSERAVREFLRARA